MKKNKSKNINKSENKEKNVKDKNKKIFVALKVAIVISLIVLVGDIFFVLYTKNKQDSKKTFFESLNAYVAVDKSYYAVGSSNMDDNGYEKATIYKYDSNKKTIWEKRFKSKYNSTFYNISKDGDDLLVVGSYEKTEEENKESIRTAIFMKYDKDGKVVFKKELQILGNSKFVDVLVLDDSYIVVGQSIYPNNVLGNDDRGGAVIVKYDKDGKELWTKNTGGNKSGLFNSVIKDGDYLYAVGKDATRYGMIAKYTLDGEKVKAVSYAKTDTLGFSNVVKLGSNFICVGAKKLNENDEYDHDIDALLVSYNDNLEKVNEVTYKDTKKGFERFNDVIIDKDSLIVIGHEAILDKENSTSKENAFNYRSFILRYNEELKKKSEVVYKEDIDDYFTDIKLVDGKYLVSGYKRFKMNRYKNFFVDYNRNFK